MKNGHLNDEIIQEFAWNPQALDAEQAAHIAACTRCQQQAANYKLLFGELEQVPKPVFTFDLQKLVLDQLMPVESVTPAGPVQQGLTEEGIISQKPDKQKSVWPWMIFTLMTLALIGAPLYLFPDSFQNIIAGVSLMVTYLIIITIVLIVAFLVVDEYRKYNKQINSLDI